MKSFKNEFLVGLLASSVAASVAIADANFDTKKAAARMGAASVTEVTFLKDSTDLTESAKAELQKFIADANKKGNISELRVIAWSDQEYPRAKVAIAARQVDLAEKRAEGVETYLKESLSMTDVSTINMAERPNSFQDFLNTPGAKVKNTLETVGAAPTSTDQTGFMGLKGKASKALVMVYLN